MTPVERVRLEDDLRRFQGTVDALILRLEHTLTALALTLDAQAATRQRLNGLEQGDDLHDAAGDLQTTAEQVRHLTRTLTNGNR